MIELTQTAQTSLDKYLHQARAYLKGTKSVDAAEVEQNITEHIENELSNAAEPVSADDLETVLQKLGSPRQWSAKRNCPCGERRYCACKPGLKIGDWLTFPSAYSYSAFSYCPPAAY